MLYVIATPIGNLKDITLRALEALKEVDFILCEDTRVTKNLLNHYEIRDKKLISYHHHTDEKKMLELVELIRNNKVALVTDAGTPGISDPGGVLIRTINQARQLSEENISWSKRAGRPRGENQEYKNIRIQERESKEERENIEVVPIPGACAAITALSVSGFPTDEFLFKGFIPHKKGRQTFIKQVLSEERTVVFYESCHRIVKCLEEFDKMSGELIKDKEIVVCRELTKKFESIYRGNIQEVLEIVKGDPIKGEYVIVVH